MIARLSGRRRHGHGLPVVRRVAAAHGGRFVLRRSEQGSLAVLELPLAADERRAWLHEPAGPGGRLPRCSPCVAAAVAAAIADGYGSSVARGYGALRPVVVAGAGLPAGKADRARSRSPRRWRCAGCRPGSCRRARWPRRRKRSGWCPQAALPAGSYLLASQLRPPQRGRAARPGSAAPAARSRSRSAAPTRCSPPGPAPAGAKVDVVVTTEPSGPGPGRTYVAAAGVPLLALGPGADGPGPGGASAATLGLTRRQALRLIAAESFARQVTLLPGG